MLTNGIHVLAPGWLHSESVGLADQAVAIDHALYLSVVPVVTRINLSAPVDLTARQTKGASGSRPEIGTTRIFIQADTPHVLKARPTSLLSTAASRVRRSGIDDAFAASFSPTVTTWDIINLLSFRQTVVTIAGSGVVVTNSPASILAPTPFPENAYTEPSKH